MRTFVIVLTAMLIAIPALARLPEAPKHCKSAKDGRYVSASYAEKHPATTYCSSVKK